MDAKRVVKELYEIFIRENTLNNIGDVYFPEQEFIRYFEKGE